MAESGRATIGALLRDAARKLDEAGIAGGQRDARMLMAHVLGISQSRLLLVETDEADPRHIEDFERLIARRLAREPVSHLTGLRAFFGRDFKVTRDVLDPRPETETLVEAALQVPFLRVLDLGTGSGAILLSLLAERPAATGLGTDLSEAALSVARENARSLALAERVEFRQSDWVSQVDGRFDLIVSNPPYIAFGEMGALAPELTHEPRMALTDEGDGLTAYRAICIGAPAHLQPGGWLMVEIGWQQGKPVSDLFADAGFSKVAVLPDLDGRDRVVQGQWLSAV
ncbi:peptide chain release factor N(5)-glutamine methyltransferase [Lutimaribacter saemankumensis]|uniref:Release factor glutamine methyltransferase n=1 Tax=Lutimaribacter saemankumensis TaxID=490829 RepID=A0A1G8H5E4_9RHOB|nr:peptide chain release factor N(5)-glutamine methyltransferase [Lutimaribacter saemankumensis]SDI01789.1 release factor glutamine methyltransferase [Lutimaribacter saemankumensis]